MILNVKAQPRNVWLGEQIRRGAREVVGKRNVTNRMKIGDEERGNEKKETEWRH